jgi:periplasmic nitrate reductase NapD
MNLSGILVMVAPAHTAEMARRLATLPGIDVHQQDEATGRIVVTQEAPSVADEVEGLKRIKALPGVELAEMVYHYFEGDAALPDGGPESLDAAFEETVPDRIKTL